LLVTVSCRYQTLTPSIFIMAISNATNNNNSNRQHTSIVGSAFWALVSGAFGAGASCFAKLAFAGEPSWLTTNAAATDEDASSSCPDLNEWMTCFQTTNCAFHWISCHLWTVLLPRIVCLMAMIICNISMVACFVGGLEDAGSIAGTALATAANFLVSAMAGYLIWNEGISLSVPGFTMVIFGTILLVLAQMPQDDDNTARRRMPTDETATTSTGKKNESSEKIF